MEFLRSLSVFGKPLAFQTPAKLNENVTPARCGVQKTLKYLDSSFLKNDVAGLLQEALLLR